MPAPLERLRLPSEPALSPDGSSVVYTVRTADVDADEQRTALWRVPAGGGDARRLTSGPADTAAAWSPDGQSIAFLRGGDGPAQIFVLPAYGGEAVQLTALPGGAGAPVWSPDGTRIAFTAAVDTAEPSANGGHTPVVIDRLRYKADGAGFLRGLRQHLFVVDVPTAESPPHLVPARGGSGPAEGEERARSAARTAPSAGASLVRQITFGDWHASAPVWSPNGRALAFGASVGPDADLSGTSDVYIVSVGEDGAAASGELRRISAPGGALVPVAWIPDRDELLVVGDREVRIGHTRLFRLPADGGEMTELTSVLDRNVMPGGPGYPGAVPQCVDGQTVLFCARDRGCTHLYAIDIDGNEPRLVLGAPDRVVSGVSVAPTADGVRAGVVVSSPRSYGAVAVVDLASGAETVLVDDTPGDISPLVPEEVSFTVSDGFTVHGWLLRHPAAPSPAPLLVDVHGGPHNAWSPVLDVAHAYHQDLAARGWAVLLLNPRGSDGYGEDFYTAAVGAWGLADEKDFLEPVDRLVSEGVADPNRLAVSGYSYGGFMACWLTGRTDRFAAAVAGGVVTDLSSMAGTSDEGRLLTELETGASSYTDPVRLAEQSPFTHVNAVQTPTLILHGLDDHRCPAGQAELWFAALRARGVPVRLVLYPGAGHLFILDGRPSHQADYSHRVVDWVTRHTSPATEVSMSRTSLDRAHWERRLSELADTFRVPGAALGIARGGETVEIGHGVTNVDTGVPVTDDTLFQIGSISKVWTATVVMGLVDEGLLDLDEPLITYLPELVLADPEVTKRVTMRHLLTHTSGIDGDVFTDTGRGDDCLERYVAALADVAINHPIGATWSYCNSGFGVAGRVIEKLTGLVWDAAMRERLFEPLGLIHTVTLPEQALLYRTAVGHVHEDGEPYRRAPVWGLVRSSGPAGLISATVGDVLTFARMHLAGGTAADGTGVLSAESVSAMQAREAELPDTHTIAQSWGLGWFRLEWNGAELVGHDGNTIGQSAFLRVLPGQDLAVTLLTNGGFARDLYYALYGEIFRELAGVEIAAPLEPPAEPPAVAVTPYVGTYERAGARLDVFDGNDGPMMRQTVTMKIAGVEHEPKEYPLVPVRDGLFAVRPPGARTWVPVTFYTLADGQPYVHMGARATPKAA